MNQTIGVNITPQSFQPTLHFSQGDVGRVFVVNVADYDIPSGATVTCVATKPSGMGFTVNGTVSGNSVTFTSTAEMTDEWGRFPAEIRIASGDVLLGTANFLMVGEKDPHPEGTTDGSAEQIIPALTLILRKIEEEMAKAEVLEESEAWAVGQRDGVDVGVDDPTYHNNSKYYKEQAELSKTAAAGSATAAETSKARAATSETNAESAATRAEAAAAAAAQVFTVAGDASFSVDADNDLWLNITIN